MTKTIPAIEGVQPGEGSYFQVVVRCVCYLTDWADFPEMETIFPDIFPTNPPVRALGVWQAWRGTASSKSRSRQAGSSDRRRDHGRTGSLAAQPRL